MDNFSPMEIHLSNLASEIEQCKTALQFYSKRADANQSYVQQREEFINQLVTIYNGLEDEFQHLSFVYPLAPIINDMLKIDPEIGTINIQLTVNPNKRSIASIRYNSL